MKTKTSLLSILLLSSNLFAQDSLMLEAITIRGSKENKTYKEMTSSVTAVKSEELESLATNNSLDALNGVSNVQVTSEKGGGETFSIRGINNTGVTGFQKDSLASIIIDDVFQSDLAIRSGSLEFWNIDSMEIYRGGQATTQGINSLAGTILLRHREPTFFREGQVKVGYGSFNRKELGVNINEELIPGKLATRFTYNKDKSDGYITNIKTGNDKWGRKDKDALNLAFNYLLDDDNRFVLDLKHSIIDNGGSYIQGTDPSKKEVNEDYDFERQSYNSQGSIKWYRNINESLKNELIFAFSKSKTDSVGDADGLPVERVIGNVDLGKRIEWFKDEMFTLENLLHYQDSKIKNTIGLNIHKYHLHNYFNFNMDARGGILNATQSDQNDKLVVSLFDSFSYDLSEKLTVNLGLRAEYAKNDFETFLDGYTYSGNPMPAYIALLNQIRGTHSADMSKLMMLPKFGFVYALDEFNNVGISYGQAYRNGGLSVNRARAYINKYAPEITHNYELSHKFEKNDWRVSNNIFLIDWRKQQVQIELSNITYDWEIRNASKSVLYGVESQVNYKVNRDHLLGASLGFVKTEFKDFKTSKGDYRGNEFPDAPQYTGLVNWSAKWTERLSTNFISRFIGSSYSDAQNTRRVSPQFYLDASARYAFSSYNIEIYGKNLLDKDYLTYNGDKNSAYYGIYSQASTPAEFGLRLTYQW